MLEGSMMFVTMVFLAVVLGLGGLFSLLMDLQRDKERFSQRIDDEFRKKQNEKAKKSTLFKNLTQMANEAGGEAVPKLTLMQRFELLIDQSGLPLTPARVILMCLVLGAVMGVLGFLLSGQIALGILALSLTAPLPILFVNWKNKQRKDHLLHQLPDALDLLSRIIRAGQTMAQAMQAIGDEFDPPISHEFAYCYEQQNLGLPPELALRDLAHRTGLLEVKILVMALLVQQQTGGNLSQLLENLAGVIRDRLRMRGKIQALTAEGRMQAVILLALPPLLFLAMLYINREYTQILLEYPSLLIGMAVFMIMGGLWIRKIVRFDF
jgi:tight adherence protein B